MHAHRELKKPLGWEAKQRQDHQSKYSCTNSACSISRWPGWIGTFTDIYKKTFPNQLCCQAYTHSPEGGIEIAQTAVICYLLRFILSNMPTSCFGRVGELLHVSIQVRYAATESRLIKHSYQMTGIMSGCGSWLCKHYKTLRQRRQWLCVVLWIHLLSKLTVKDINKLSGASICDSNVLFSKSRQNHHWRVFISIFLQWFMIISCSP